METRQEKRAGNQTLKKKKWYQDILLWTVGIILGLLMLLQFSVYLIFRPEHPITWEDKRAVIEYCEYKYRKSSNKGERCNSIWGGPDQI